MRKECRSCAHGNGLFYGPGSSREWTECRRFPPTMTTPADPKSGRPAEHRFMLLDVSLWCGEFKLRHPEGQSSDAGTGPEADAGAVR